MKRYVDEDRSREAEELLLSDPEWVTAAITLTEVRLALHRRLDDQGRAAALAAFERAGGRSLPIATFDVRLARAARSLGHAVVGG